MMLSDVNPEAVRVPRLSRQEALLRYHALTITQQNIMASLYTFKVMSTRQIADMFSDAEDEKNRRIIAGRNSKVLVDNGLVVRGTTTAPGHGQQKARYHLSRVGLYVCLNELGVTRLGPVSDSKYKRILVSRMISHHEGVVDVVVSMLRKKDWDLGELCEWQNDGELIYSYDHGGSTHKIVPDGKGILLTSDNVRHAFYVEFERTLRKPEFTRQKAKKYLRFSINDEFVVYDARHTFPPILWVVGDDKLYPVLKENLVMSVQEVSSLEVAAHYLTVGMARLSDINNYSLGAHAPIWEAVHDDIHELTFLDLSKLSYSKRRAYRSDRGDVKTQQMTD